jgi:hypothetical protein
LRAPPNLAGVKIYFDCGDQDDFGFESGATALDQSPLAALPTNRTSIPAATIGGISPSIFPHRSISLGFFLADCAV